jgi:hypothetical protein
MMSYRSKRIMYPKYSRWLWKVSPLSARSSWWSIIARRLLPTKFTGAKLDPFTGIDWLMTPDQYGEISFAVRQIIIWHLIVSHNKILPQTVRAEIIKKVAFIDEIFTIETWSCKTITRIIDILITTLTVLLQASSIKAIFVILLYWGRAESEKAICLESSSLSHCLRDHVIECFSFSEWTG